MQGYGEELILLIIRIFGLVIFSMVNYLVILALTDKKRSILLVNLGRSDIS